MLIPNPWAMPTAIEFHAFSVAAILAARLSPVISQVIFVAVALILLIPGRRIENVLPRNQS